MFDFITLEDFDSFPHFRIGCAIFEKCSESFYQVSNDVSIHLINIGTTFIFLSKKHFYGYLNGDQLLNKKIFKFH